MVFSSGQERNEKRLFASLFGWDGAQDMYRELILFEERVLFKVHGIVYRSGPLRFFPKEKQRSHKGAVRAPDS